ncbi:4a-hydroxytetrahydrobiopterin dehydratase [Saccharopolyspora rhizosphaerae]|uniref:Putative pterin-4-alpha-carbinolamine dehydratase n=1 Tax=Saccharopolyspora rhizosphaerae TaxID=2492662 RepID=A0A3R8R8B4_9PSEU|nr:4a-hydroxytetrahydrobiopterin dehydratase [Saccharopolyspora rhizosphaerae]RRO20710.1 4a-hydroxytetrahydrobiopterin dehydratase [Saccharopolyspora rhizosphaerae]
MLSDDEVARALQDLTGWTGDARSISRTWTVKGFNGAVQLANVVAWAANRANHHPDIRIHDYKCVTVTSLTHDEGGTTEHDLALARRLNGILDA